MPTTLIEPLNIAAATVVLQIMLLTIMVVGTILDGTPSRAAQRESQVVVIFFGLVISVIVMAFSQAYYPTWAPLLGDVPLSFFTLRQSTALTLVFFVDYALTFFLIARSGGGRNSPFGPILFLLPTVALFLRQPGSLVLIYGVFTAALFLWSVNFIGAQAGPLSHSPYSNQHERSKHSNLAFQFVTILCLVMTIMAGYITRPVAVG